MICLIKRRAEFYKRHLLDLYGHAYVYKKPTKVIRIVRMLRDERRARKGYYKQEFIYNYRKKIRFRRTKKLKPRYLLPRILKHYYLVLKPKDFIRFSNIAIRKSGYYEGNYLLLLECRLFMLVYRLNFVSNIFIIKSLLDAGLFTINNERKYHSHCYAKVGDFISIKRDYIPILFNDIYLRLCADIIFGNSPEFLFVNYKLLFAILLEAPSLKDIIFPVNEIDVFLASEYYIPRP